MAEIRHLGFWCQNAKTRFSQKLSNLVLWCLRSRTWPFQRTHYWTPKIQDARDPPSWKSTWRHFFSADDGPIWIKCHRLVQNDMSTAAIWSKSKPDLEFQYGWRFGKLNGMSSQSHVSHCRVLPIGEFTVTIPEPHATLQGVRIPSAVMKIVFFCHILFYFCFFKCSMVFDEDGFRIVTDTHVGF